jgi:hypothetical protein
MVTASGPGGFGISITKIAKKGAGLAKKGVKVAAAPIYYGPKLALDLALKPVRSRVNSLVSSRARKLSWTRRKSLQPTKVEVGEARAWVKQRFRAKGPHGMLLATLTGSLGIPQNVSAPNPNFNLDHHREYVDSSTVALVGLGVAPAVAAAAVPALIALVTQLTKSLQQRGEVLPPGFQPAVEAVVAPTQEEAEQKMIESVEESAAEVERQALQGAGESIPTWAVFALAFLGLGAAGAGAYLAASSASY